MSVAAINSGLSFKGVKNTLKKFDFPEIDPSYKYLFGNGPEAEPTILKARHRLNFLA